jgi:hypothetical protein
VAGLATVLALAGCRPTSSPTVVRRVLRGLAGVVYDSLTHHALQAGRYVATFYHRALDTLGLQASARLVDVTAGGAWLPMSIPSAEHLRTIECGARAVMDSNGVLIGRVVDATSRSGMSRADVTARWSEVAIARGGVSVQPKTARAQTADGGWFNLCGVPLNVEISVQASRGGDRTGTIAVRVPATGIATHDLFVGGTAVVELRGNVIGSNGGPIPHAHVTLDGLTGSATWTRVVSNRAGRPASAASFLRPTCRRWRRSP